jgi:SanA protein
LLLLILLTVLFCNWRIEQAARGKLYDQATVIPFNKVGLLLGTSKYLAGGYINPYYSYRVQAALELYKVGKIQYIIVSGDNSTKSYNEPQTFQEDLIKGGVDSSHIYLDYAGFRTFDSMIRLRDVFGQTKATVISQPFHNERALYIASREGIAAIGFNAKDVNAQAGFKTQLREKLARAIVDPSFIKNEMDNVNTSGFTFPIQIFFNSTLRLYLYFH